ncbi:MAG: hypothetical protein U5O39_07810 [Gammaproteobacteria bacterium]|nr:hypothetical protein [Gammaproteobacteria bacterium]
MSDRWKLGDVLIWFITGNEQNARTDADVKLVFYSADDEPIGWLRAYERGDLGGFEQGETNLGFIGNLNQQAWLKQLLSAGTRLEVSVNSPDPGNAAWCPESISLDFRVGPVVDVSTARTWNINEWIVQGEEPYRYDAEGDPQTGASLFEEVGFEKELELETGVGEPPE